jgi:hypothetical protein
VCTRETADESILFHQYRIELRSIPRKKKIISLQKKTRLNFSHHVLLLLSQIDLKIPPTSISIISPYSSQVYLLSQTIHSLISNEIEIGSIDSNQGRENDVVIISLVRSNETVWSSFSLSLFCVVSRKS